MVLKIFRLRSYEEYSQHMQRISSLLKEHLTFLSRYVPDRRREFCVPGYSYPSGELVDFIVDYQHAAPDGPVNWRERVLCPLTHFNNRMRATFHLFDIEMNPYPDKSIYITEQVTPIYKYFLNSSLNVCGSEFIGDSLPLGACNSNGVRNEDICRLTFQDESFDMLISLDVLEHVPEYEQGFRECARVLKPGGRMMWSVPFIPSSSRNVIRARLVNGDVFHDLPPEYHGDPLSDKGVLCFQHFGWEMLEQMRSAGFSDAYALCYFSTKFGYLGGEQFMFFAVK